MSAWKGVRLAAYGFLLSTAGVAARIGVDDYRSEVLPEDNAACIQHEHELGHKVVMIVDVINDSPFLSAADIGIAIALHSMNNLLPQLEIA